MKLMSIIGLTLITLLVFTGCEDKTVYIDEPDRPATPTGLTSISGDGFVELMWYPVEMAGVSDYRIYWAPGGVDPTNADNYEFMVEVDAEYTSYIDNDVTNGNTYYYAVLAVNTLDEYSYLSNYVMDTPRPDGHDVRIYDYHNTSTRDFSGYDLHNQVRVPYDHANCDIYLNLSTVYDEFFITVGDVNHYIQDYGYVEDFDDIGYAPDDGWSAFVDVEAIEGHMYMLALDRGDYFNFAKIWITDLDKTSGTMEFSWAYQTDPDNRELSIGAQNAVPKYESKAVN